MSGNKENCHSYRYSVGLLKSGSSGIYLAPGVSLGNAKEVPMWITHADTSKIAVTCRRSIMIGFNQTTPIYGLYFIREFDGADYFEQCGIELEGVIGKLNPPIHIVSYFKDGNLMKPVGLGGLILK